MITASHSSGTDPTDENTPPGPNARRYLLLSRPRHKLRVAILDDHPVITIGTATFLRGQADFEVIHTETTAEKFMAALKTQPCDVAVVDFYLPQQMWDGTNFIRRLRRLHPDMAIITFSAGKVSETEYAAFRAGANGYMPKAAPLATLADIIRGAVANPRDFVAYSNGALRLSPPQHPDSRLTTAEIEILRQISQGLSVTQIAARLLRSKKTISTHKRRAMKKLDLSDDLSLALYLNEKFERNVGK